MKKYVVLIGVGGVGKTTLVYRLAGVPIAPSPTKRPGIYRIRAEAGDYYILDPPGQYIDEVVESLLRIAHMYFDRALFIYDLTRYDTLQALYQIAEEMCVRGRCIAAREVWAVGNKRDVAASIGVEHEPDLALLHAGRYVKISALVDPLEKLAELLP